MTFSLYLFLFIQSEPLNDVSIVSLAEQTQSYLDLFTEYGKIFLFLLLIAALISQVVRSD
jgi:hypothetical protein